MPAESRPSPRPQSERGFTLSEVLVASFVIGIALVGVFPLISITTQGNTFDRDRINAANAARRRIEAIRAMPYDTVGVGAAGTTPPFQGFYEATPNDVGYTAGKDHYLVDVFSLATGISATRRAIVEAVDDPLDGTGAADTDANTVDYKLITVTVEWSERGQKRTLSQRTYMSGATTVVPGGGGGGAMGMGGMGMGLSSGANPDDPGGE